MRIGGMMMKKCPSYDFNSFCEWCGGKLPESAEVKSEYVDGSNDSFNPNPNINSGMNTNQRKATMRVFSLLFHHFRTFGHS